MSALSMKVSLEALAENEIQEIAYDGSERAAPPLNQSESLAKLAQLIDFGKKNEESKDEKAKEAENKAAQEAKQAKPWPWEWLRNSLVSSLTEMNVLSDCLSIAKDRRVMILDQIQNDYTEPKSAYQLVARKQALQNAAEIFNKGAERIKSIQQDAIAKSQQSLEFYSELWSLRQNWRIKKVGQHILGDLSYKSAGSTYWQSGTFEVFKRSDNKPGTSAIDVKLPTELQGSAHIQVSIHMTTAEDSVSKLDSMITLPQVVPTDHGEKARWQTKLETAQNVMYCKELFSQICREAFRMGSSIPHMVVNNQVIVHLFPEFKMHIMFCHSDTVDEDAEAIHSVADQSLQIALHMLLREQHYQTLHKDPPHPVTTLVGPTKRRRIAGPECLSRSELMAIERPDRERILERMVDIGRHVVLRLRAVETVEHLALTISDPLIQLHTDNLSNEINSQMKVYITSPSYDQIRTSFILKIHKGKVIAIGKSGHEIDLAYEPQRLEDYIMWQVSQYQIQAVYALAKMMGCQILSLAFSSVSQDSEMFGTNPSILISSPDGSKAVAVKSNTVSGLEVFLSAVDPSSLPACDLVIDKQWSLLRPSFNQVDLVKTPGKNFTHKMELLLAAYSSRTEPMGYE